MRFGKKTRNLAAVGRRFFGEPTLVEAPVTLASAQEPIATDHEEIAMTTPQTPDEPMVAGDPTQRLLTALGRFQRQVGRAEEGISQEAWCDECMNQLIIGIEIALTESWADVKEALTDTARILQTYEDAGMASDCVPFLKDSYEILCLMVGDLIVDNVRSGVMKKWRERYERALDALANLGLTLVDDEATLEREGQQETARDAENRTIDTPDPFAPEPNNEPQSGSAFDALIGNSEDQFAGDNGGAFHHAPMPEKDNDPFAFTTDDDSPFGTPPSTPTGTLASEMPSLDELIDGTDDDSASEMSLSNDFTADEPTVFDPPSFDQEQDSETPAVEEDDSLSTNEDNESETPEPMELDLSAEVEEEPELTPEPVPIPDPVQAPAPVAEPEPEPGTPEALWKTAQQAMALGNVGDAKVFALQLAANMARLEAQQAEAHLAEIESTISSNTEEITAAEQAVADAEERLRALEEQRTQCQQEFDGKREHIQQLRENVSNAEGAVSDLDRQIAELEVRRETERERLLDCQEILDDSLTEESRMQAELDTLNEEEGGAQENLQSVRDRVQALQEKGGDHTTTLDAARRELESRNSSILDIEKTIGHVGGGAAPAAAETTNEEHNDHEGNETDGHDAHAE